MDPLPPFDHPHHRRGHHHYPEHHHFAGGSGGGAAAAAPARSRYEYGGAYEPHPHQYHFSDHYSHHHHHHHPRVDHHLPPAPTPPPPPPPPPPLPQHRHEGPHYGLPLRALPDAYSSPPYHDPSPHHHYHGHQRHGDDDDFLSVDEIRRVGGHNHHHPPLHQQLPWEEADEERRRYGASHQLRLSPSGSRKRQRCGVLDCGDLESTSSSGPPPRRQPHPSYAPDDSFVDRITAHPGYISHEGFSIHSDSKGSRKIQMPTQMTLPGSPHATGAAYLRRLPQKSAPTRVSVWQRIEENPAMYEPSSPLQLPKEVHISPCKSNNVGPALKELASAISVDCRGKSADGNDGDSNTATKKNPAKKNEKVLASVLVKPTMEAKEKEVAVKKTLSKPDKVQKNVANSNSKSLVSTACPGAGVKKVKKIVIKKIVRKINGKGNQISSPIVSEKRDSIDASANACEKEEGEITTSSFEKDVISAHDPIAVSDTAGFGNGVHAQKEENPSGKNAAAIKPIEILNPTSVSGSALPANEECRNPMNPVDNNKTALAIESTEVLEKSGNEHPRKEDDAISIGSGVNATFVYEKNFTQEEVKIPTVSGEMDVAVVSNSVRVSDAWKRPQCEDSSMEESKVPKDGSVNNTVYVDGITANCNTTEISGNEDTRREGGKILIGRNEENSSLVNNFTGSPSTEDVRMTAGKDAQKKEGVILIGSSEKSIGFLGDSVGTCRTTEFSVSKDAHNKEDNMLIHSSEKDFMSVNSWGSLNNTEVSEEDIQEKEDRIPMESIIASTSRGSGDMQVNEGRMPMELSEDNTFGGSEDIQEKEGRMPMGSSETNTLVEHANASNTTDVSANEDTQKKESHKLIESCKTNTFETMQHTEAPSTEVIMSMSLGRKVAEGPMRSNERCVGTIGNSANTLEFDLAGGTENNRMEDLVNDKTALNETDIPLDAEDSAVFDLPSSRNVESTYVPPLYDPMEDSTSDYILNIGLGRNATSKAAEMMDLRSAHMSPENDSLIHYGDYLSGNCEQSVPTALTLGSNIYFGSTEADDQSEESHELVEGKQGLDAATEKILDSPCTAKVLTGEGLINTGIQNWLTLPPSVNKTEMPRQFLNYGVTVSEGRLGLDHSMDDTTSIIQDHDITQDMDQHGSQDHSIKLCSSDLPRSHLLAPKESSEDVEGQGEIVLPGLPSTSSVNVLGHCGYQTVDIPVDNLNKPIPSTLESSPVMDLGRVSCQLCIDQDHINNSNTENPGVESNGKQDSLSSWIEAIVSEAKKEHQPGKSTLLSVGLPDKLLAPKEGSKKTVRETVVTSAVKSPQINFASSTLPKVAPKQVTLPSSSWEPTRSNQNARHRTWYRGNIASTNSSLHASQPLGLPSKLPLKKNDKAQNSYIRKGNALIRNPSSGNHPRSSSSQDTQNKLNKPVVRRSMNFVRKADSNDFIANSNISVERPKTPPLPLHTKSISCTTNLLEPLSQTLQKQHDHEIEKEDPTVQPNSGVENPNIRSAQKSEPSDASKVVYVRPKSNQLLAAQRQHPGDSVNSTSTMDKILSLQAPISSDLYLKKRKNQIVLSSCSPSDGQNTKDTLPAENFNSDENKDLMIACSNNGIPGAKDRPHKALQTTNSAGCFSHVWTLNGQQPQRKGFVGTSHMRAFPRILPWKRKTFCTSFRNSHTSLSNISSVRIVRKLLQTRRRDMIYTVSTDGFSLRKSGVLSVGGSSLKWSRSLEKRSQKINKEATLAVGEVERKKREKRKRQSLHDQYTESVAGNQLRNNRQASSDLRKPSTCNEYIRVSKGNQLVRNPKNVIRMLASDKVRWSLHTVRSRLAKKQQYCQFFTRFGECKKPRGKCPYIHDQAKVTICTKFLKGLCSNTSCKLTHKVLPERMPDCSYFLRGLCTNIACPYRHVKVNLNAPLCEDFLKGYCADGDECHKKHSYVCPVFEATGECPQRSRCKLHHPKNKVKSKRSRSDFLQNSSWCRYFDTSIGHESETRKVSSGEEEREKPQRVLSDGDLSDFISLDADADADADEDVADLDESDDIPLMELDSGDLGVQTDNLDALIKPLRIMRTARV